MTTTIESIDRGIRVTGEMTVYAASQIKQPLLDALAACPGDIQLDLSQVCEFDTAGLQLLLMARAEAWANGRTLSVETASSAVREALTLCGASGFLNEVPNVRSSP